MLVVTIRSDKPKAEIGLFSDVQQLAYEEWTAHYQLAETIHNKIHKLLKTLDKDWSDIEAIVCYMGPGSFTGLRIGLTVGNSLSYGLSVPIVGAQGKSWIRLGLGRLVRGDNDEIALPYYGSPIHVSQPKK